MPIASKYLNRVFIGLCLATSAVCEIRVFVSTIFYQQRQLTYIYTPERGPVQPRWDANTCAFDAGIHKFNQKHDSKQGSGCFQCLSTTAATIRRFKNICGGRYCCASSLLAEQSRDPVIPTQLHNSIPYQLTTNAASIRYIF